ncbi:uncharacterized protein LOC142297177 [Anomaloglossus baeobatrachus]|uniref:uncharacterized protein LOC142297177 n=1 Tax=Anomaloglossus baeobatrachus TaxID=238106 RepID=UPI003F50A97E
MAAAYKKDEKAVLIQMCEERGLDGFNKTKEMLICALVEDNLKDQHDVAQEHGTSEAPGNLAMDLAPGRSAELSDSKGSGSNPSSRSGMDSYLPMILQQLGECDSQARLQFVLKERQAEREFAERQAARAERQAEAERAEREAQARRDHELKVLQHQQQTSSPLNCESNNAISFKPRPERFPVMEKDGDLDTFLRGFEKTCRQYQLPSGQWAQYLTPGLRGKALEVFAALPPALDEDYEAINLALIRKYQLTPEVYRIKFRTLQYGPHDSYSDVVDGLRTTFDQWVQGLSITTFEELKELMVKDQLLHLCPVEVRQFVMDREPKEAAKAAQIVDTYEANRASEVRKPSTASGKGGKMTTTTPAPANRHSGGPAPSSSTRPTSDTRRCFTYD